MVYSVLSIFGKFDVVYIMNPFLLYIPTFFPLLTNSMLSPLANLPDFASDLLNLIGFASALVGSLGTPLPILALTSCITLLGFLVGVFGGFTGFGIPVSSPTIVPLGFFEPLDFSKSFITLRYFLPDLVLAQLHLLAPDCLYHTSPLDNFFCLVTIQVSPFFLCPTTAYDVPAPFLI